MSDAASPLLEVRGLVKDYPGVRALDGVDLTVTRGQVHCLIGQNGAGKSTLIKCVSGLVEPTAGAVRFEGEPLPVGDPNASIARGIATIYQELDLVPHLSVALNVFLGHEHKRGPLLNRAAMHRETRALFARLGDAGISPTAPVSTLRPAQQQVVSMARALSHSVKLLILDEPSAVLDDVEVKALFGVVRRLTAEGVGVIWISHRLGEVAELGDMVTVLKEGRTVATELAPDTPVDTLIRHMVGGRMETLFPERRPHQEKTVLEVHGLTRTPDVHDASFTLREGEILGLAGLVGSGSHRAVAPHLRPGPQPVGRSEGRRPPPSAWPPRSGHPGRARVGARRAKVGGPVAGLEHGPQHLDCGPPPVPAWPVHRSSRRAGGSQPPPTVTEHATRRSGAGGAAVLRRQPAEGRAGSVVVAILPGAVTRRTDPWRGRRRPV
jgi:ABC-type multidrug transport system ATPase subunit